VFGHIQFLTCAFHWSRNTSSFVKNFKRKKESVGNTGPHYIFYNHTRYDAVRSDRAVCGANCLRQPKKWDLGVSVCKCFFYSCVVLCQALRRADAG
jgi:hypothetical protein